MSCETQLPQQAETPCLKCVFGVYEIQPGELPTQTGCKLGMLEKLAAHGADIIEATDNNINFYVVRGRTCPAVRGIVWSRRFENLTEDELLEKVVSEMRIKCTATILCKEDTTYEDLEKTINTLKSHNQRLPHALVLVVNSSKYLSPNVIRDALRGLGTWSIEQVLEKDIDINRLIDVGIKRVNTPHYAIFVAGKEVPKDYFYHISKALYDDMERFVILNTDDPEYHNTFVLTRIHKQLCGFKQVIMIDDKNVEFVAAKNLSEKISNYLRNNELECQEIYQKNLSEILPE